MAINFSKNNQNSAQAFRVNRPYYDLDTGDSDRWGLVAW